MLVVLGLLLVTTATATIAVQSTFFGLRASGNRTRENHTQYVSEAALLGATSYASRLATCQNQRRVFASPCPSLVEFGEPAYGVADGELCYRITSGMFQADGVFQTSPTAQGACGSDQAGPLGTCLAYNPFYVVDVELVEAREADQVGQRLDEDRFRNMLVVMTARGRTRVAGDVGSGAEAGYNQASGARGFHETANDARAYVLVPGVERCAATP